jgi:DNA-binding transcriptional MocR family regulator
MSVPYVGISVRGARGAADLVAAVEREVKSGRIAAGCRLPPVRALEQQLGISKNTVLAAYDELVARGLLESREREGFFVSAREIIPRVAPWKEPPAARLKPPAPLPGRSTPGTLAISSVFIDADLLPRERLADCARSVLRNPGLEPFSDFQGYRPLREAIARRLQARGMDVHEGQVVTTTGSQQALDIIARSLDVRRASMESPVYPHARYLFEQHGLTLAGLPLDPFNGIDLADWEERLSTFRPGMVYAITSFQNPTGYSYTTSELVALLEMADRYGFALLEDDWGSDMLSGSEYRPSLRLLGGKNVIYVNSFTKKLLPSMRVGFLVASEDLIPSLVSAKRLSCLGHSWLSEATVAEFLDRGYYDSHLGALQKELDARYQACLAALSELMPEGVRWTTPGGGPTLWVDVPRSVDLGKLRQRCLKRNVLIEDASGAFLADRPLHGFRVSYAFAPAEKVRKGIQVIAEELWTR